MSLILKINDRFLDRQVEFFNEFTFDLTFNSVASTFSFSFLFDPDNPEHKEVFVPSHLHEATILHIPDGQTKPIQVLKGLILQHNFKASAKPTLATISGYSFSGQIEDCTIPNGLYPLQTSGASLASIARRLTNPFDIELVIDPSVQGIADASYKSITANPTQSVKDFLNEMAKQRDVYMSHDNFGRLLLTKPNTEGTPIFDFDLTQEVPDGFEFDFTYNGQAMHRTITVRKEADVDEGTNAGQSTIVNPYVIGSVTRPTSVSQSTGDDNNTALAARRARANELRALPLKITIDKWNIGDKLITPNNTIMIKAPQLFIYRKEKFFIESVNFKGNHESLTCQLNCVLPEVYSQSDTVVDIYRGINIHPPNHV